MQWVTLLAIVAVYPRALVAVAVRDPRRRDHAHLPIRTPDVSAARGTDRAYGDGRRGRNGRPSPITSATCCWSTWLRAHQRDASPPRVQRVRLQPRLNPRLTERQSESASGSRCSPRRAAGDFPESTRSKVQSGCLSAWRSSMRATPSSMSTSSAIGSGRGGSRSSARRARRRRRRSARAGCRPRPAAAWRGSTARRRRPCAIRDRSSSTSFVAPSPAARPRRAARRCAGRRACTACTARTTRRPGSATRRRRPRPDRRRRRTR